MMRRVFPIVGIAAVLMLVFGTLVFPAGGPVSAEPLEPTVKPDAVLNSGDQFVKVSTNVNISDPALIHSPVECRSAPFDQTCDVYRIKLKRDMSPEALNFVFFSLEFEPVAATPPLSAAVLGYPAVPVGDLDVYIFDQEDHRLGQDYPGGGDVAFALETLKGTPLKPVAEILEPELIGDSDPNDFPPGGTGFNVPERGGFTAKQDVYDIVVSAQQGANSAYTLRVGFSNEKFASPFEVLDNLNNPTSGFGSNVGDTTPQAPAFSPSVSDTSSSSSPLADANVLPDTDLAGIGLGINERFEAPPSFAFSGARNVANTPKPPSGLVLLAALVIVPLGVAGTGAEVMRRRRRALI